FLRTWLFS
ncbi:Phenylalanine--tRNA ligase alpha subunit, partial [Haemophilus influenzae]